jgi:DNA-binding CsgD family transcriptional regulator
MKEKQLIENLYERKDTKERALKIWLLRIEGNTQTEIAKKLHISRTTVWNHLKKIKETGAVLTYEGINEMKQLYRDRKELLIRETFKQYHAATDVNTKLKALRELNKIIDTTADAFWRTHKEETLSEKSPLDEVREWIHKTEQRLG